MDLFDFENEIICRIFRGFRLHELYAMKTICKKAYYKITCLIKFILSRSEKKQENFIDRIIVKQNNIIFRKSSYFNGSMNGNVYTSAGIIYTIDSDDKIINSKGYLGYYWYFTPLKIGNKRYFCSEHFQNFYQFHDIYTFETVGSIPLHNLIGITVTDFGFNNNYFYMIIDDHIHLIHESGSRTVVRVRFKNVKSLIYVNGNILICMWEKFIEIYFYDTKSSKQYFSISTIKGVFNKALYEYPYLVVQKQCMGICCPWDVTLVYNLTTFKKQVITRAIMKLNAPISLKNYVLFVGYIDKIFAYSLSSSKMIRSFDLISPYVNRQIEITNIYVNNEYIMVESYEDPWYDVCIFSFK